MYFDIIFVVVVVVLKVVTVSDPSDLMISTQADLGNPETKARLLDCSDAQFMTLCIYISVLLFGSR